MEDILDGVQLKRIFAATENGKEMLLMDVREKLVELLDIIIQPGQKTLGDIADYLIRNGVTVQEWISASEPPKKITNKVIVLCKNGYMGYGHYEDYKGERTWYNLESGKPFTDWDLEDCESYEVTHWMPMPQPLKGE